MTPWTINAAFFSYFSNKNWSFRLEFRDPTDSNYLFTQRLELHARAWQQLEHPNVGKFFGLAFNFGYMPALILEFYENSTVVKYVEGQGNEAKLDMVSGFRFV